MSGKLSLTLLLVSMLVLSACSNSNEEFVSDVPTVNKVSELEEKIEELNNIIAEQSNIIEELEMKLNVDQIEIAGNPQGDSNDSIPILELGETYSDDKIEVTISRIEYVTSSNKGVQVYFEVVNKSENPLESPGSFIFSLEESQFEEEFNRIGYSINFDPYGYIYQDEERKGNYHYIFEREIDITEITYHAHRSEYTNEGVIATWVID